MLSIIASILSALCGASLHHVFPELVHVPGDHGAFFRSAVATCRRDHTVFAPSSRLMLGAGIVGAMALAQVLPTLYWPTLIILAPLAVILTLFALNMSFAYTDIKKLIRLQCIRNGIPLCAGCGYLLDTSEAGSPRCSECGAITSHGANEKRSIHLLRQHAVLPLLSEFSDANAALAAVNDAFKKHPLIMRYRGRMALAIVIIEVIALAFLLALLPIDLDGYKPQVILSISLVAAISALAWRLWCVRVIRRELAATLWPPSPPSPPSSLGPLPSLRDV